MNFIEKHWQHFIWFAAGVTFGSGISEFWTPRNKMSPVPKDWLDIGIDASVIVFMLTLTVCTAWFVRRSIASLDRLTEENRAAVRDIEESTARIRKRWHSSEERPS